MASGHYIKSDVLEPLYNEPRVLKKKTKLGLLGLSLSAVVGIWCLSSESDSSVIVTP